MLGSFTLMAANHNDVPVLSLFTTTRLEYFYFDPRWKALPTIDFQVDTYS